MSLRDSSSRPRGAVAAAAALFRARSKHGLTHEELGKRVGTSLRTVARWESGGSMPPRKARTRIVDAFAALDRETAVVLAEALDVAPPGPRPQEASTRAAAVDAALTLAADALGLPVPRVSAALWIIALHLRAEGATLADAQAVLGQRMKGRTPA